MNEVLEMLTIETLHGGLFKVAAVIVGLVMKRSALLVSLVGGDHYSHASRGRDETRTDLSELKPSWRGRGSSCWA